MSAPVRLDLHVHSEHSPDGTLPVARLAELAAVAGLTGFALTDHNTIDGHRQLRDLAGSYPSLWLIPGVEVSTREGHLLVYGVEELPPRGRPAEETLRWVRARGGHAIVAHPFRWSHGMGRKVTSRLAADGIEAVNGHNSALANAKAGLLAARRSLGATGGSDAHREGEVGLAFTEFPEGPTRPDELWDEIARGRSVASGRALPLARRIGLATRTLLLRAGRGFRPI